MNRITMKTVLLRRRCLVGSLHVVVLAAMVFPVFPARAADTIVNIENFTFDPPRVTVQAGATVIWRNHDDIPHVVASSKTLFKSKALDTDDQFSFTFSTPGVYEYFCSLHPRMIGTIVVKAAIGEQDP